VARNLGGVIPVTHTNGTLNAAHERFAREYLSDLNATAAYQRAYPRATAKSARTAGPRLLAIVGVSERVAQLKAERAARLEITQDYVLTRLRENVERAMQAYAEHHGDRCDRRDQQRSLRPRGPARMRAHLVSSVQGP